MKATEQYFPVVLFIMLHKVVLTFVSVNEFILKSDYSNEIYSSVLFCGAVYSAAHPPPPCKVDVCWQNP